MNQSAKHDVFGGEADSRQTEDTENGEKFSLFRKRYRKLSEEELRLHDEIKDKADELALLIRRVNNVGQGDADVKARNVDFAIVHLEVSVYRAVKALTA